MLFGNLHQKNMNFKQDMLFLKLRKKKHIFYGRKKQNKSFSAKIVNVYSN